jgi:proline dehydrogenase
MEDYPAVAPTLAALRTLREQVPTVGVAVQAALRRSEADCGELAEAGARVRLCKGAYEEPVGVGHVGRHEVDRSYVRCLRVLMAGSGYPMVATHDPRLIEIAGALAIRYQRPADAYEYQMLYGVRPAEQVRLARAGQRVRVYLPYGADWYPYLVRRLAERPANLTFFLRSLATRT